MKIKDVIEVLETIVPLEVAETWDHCGLQVGHIEKEITGVLVTLNVDANTIQQAIDHGCNFIISHHPFFFNAFKTIDLQTVFGQNVVQVIKHDLTVYSMHTNYDRLRMNRLLLKKMGCDQVEEVDLFYKGTFNQPINSQVFCQRIKDLFQLNYLRICGRLPANITSISLCAGSGHDYISSALKLSDVYLTGDLTYTHAMEIIQYPFAAVIEVPHFIESFFKEDIIQLLNSQKLKLQMSEEKDYFEII